MRPRITPRWRNHSATTSTPGGKPSPRSSAERRTIWPSTCVRTCQARTSWNGPRGRQEEFAGSESAEPLRIFAVIHFRWRVAALAPGMSGHMCARSTSALFLNCSLPCLSAATPRLDSPNCTRERERSYVELETQLDRIISPHFGKVLMYPKLLPVELRFISRHDCVTHFWSNNAQVKSAGKC
jgi:hypothetical protein